MSKGRRIKESEKINKKKVLFILITVVVIVMIVLSLKDLLTPKSNVKEVKPQITYFSVNENGKWGVIDNQGNQIINCDYSDKISIPNQNKPIFICVIGTDYINETYSTVVLNEKAEPIFTNYSGVEALENSNEKLSWYETNLLKYSNNGKYGLIDLDGNIVLDAIYDNLYLLPGIEKSLIIEKDGLKGLVNTSAGDVIIEPKYVDIKCCTDSFDHGYVVKNSSNKVGIINIDKKEILEEKYDEILPVASDTYYVVRENGNIEIVSNKGEIVLNSGFESVKSISTDLFIVSKGGKYGIINKLGEEVLSSEFEDLKFGMQDSFVAKKDSKYGIIDSNQNQKVNYVYSDINYLSQANFYIAEKDNLKTDIIDSTYNTVLDNILISELNLDGGYLRIREDEEYKYYNFKLEEKSNKEILSTNSLFLVKKFGKFGYENQKGQLIVDCIYDDAKEQNQYGYCAVKKNGLWGVLKSDGTTILEPSINLDNNLYVDFISVWHKFDDKKANFYVK